MFGSYLYSIEKTTINTSISNRINSTYKNIYNIPLSKKEKNETKRDCGEAITKHNISHFMLQDEEKWNTITKLIKTETTMIKKKEDGKVQ